MSFITKIEWTARLNAYKKLQEGATWNPWSGCTKVSSGCANCYAEARDKRYFAGVHWGKGQPRLLHAEGTWREPHRMNAKAKRDAWRPAVFLGSLCDWADEEVPREWSLRALKTVQECPHLEWLLLTKRTKNAASLLAEAFPQGIPEWIRVGTSIDDPKSLYRIPQLMEIEASHFLSVEPLLAQVDLFPYLQARNGFGIDQVIVGGESGENARPMNHSWVAGIHNDCWRTGTPFFFKQNGEWAPTEVIQDPQARAMCHLGRVPVHEFPDGNKVYKVGKKTAGNRWLDGKLVKKTTSLPANPMRLTRESCSCDCCDQERRLL